MTKDIESIFKDIIRYGDNLEIKEMAVDPLTIKVYERSISGSVANSGHSRDIIFHNGDIVLTKVLTDICGGSPHKTDYEAKTIIENWDTVIIKKSDWNKNIGQENYENTYYTIVLKPNSQNRNRVLNLKKEFDRVTSDESDV